VKTEDDDVRLKDTVLYLGKDFVAAGNPHHCRTLGVYTEGLPDD